MYYDIGLIPTTVCTVTTTCYLLPATYYLPTSYLLVLPATYYLLPTPRTSTSTSTFLPTIRVPIQYSTTSTYYSYSYCTFYTCYSTYYLLTYYCTYYEFCILVLVPTLYSTVLPGLLSLSPDRAVKVQYEYRTLRVPSTSSKTFYSTVLVPSRYEQEGGTSTSTSTVPLPPTRAPPIAAATSAALNS